MVAGVDCSHKVLGELDPRNWWVVHATANILTLKIDLVRLLFIGVSNHQF
jgi:hypothetical protein